MSDMPNRNLNSEPVARKVERLAAEAVKPATEAAAAGLKKLQEQATSGLNRVSELARLYADAQRETIETVAHAGKIYGEGLQGLAKHAADVSRVQLEDGMAHLRSLAGVKSVTDLVHLQTEFARATASRTLAEGSTLVEGYLKVAGEALAPVTARAREAAEKVKQAA